MKVRFYLTSSGANPVQKHLLSLHRAEKELVLAAIGYIGAHGLDGTVGARQIRGKLWEIKAPAREIEIAERRMKEVT